MKINTENIMSIPTKISNELYVIEFLRWLLKKEFVNDRSWNSNEESGIEFMKKLKTILPKKDIYGEFQNVKLTKEEYEKLVIKFGDVIAKEKIEILSSGKESKGYKYSSDYAAILTWSRKDDKDKNNGHKQNLPQSILSNEEMVKVNEDWIKQHGGQIV